MNPPVASTRLLLPSALMDLIQRCPKQRSTFNGPIRGRVLHQRPTNQSKTDVNIKTDQIMSRSINAGPAATRFLSQLVYFNKLPKKMLYNAIYNPTVIKKGLFFFLSLSFSLILFRFLSLDQSINQNNYRHFEYFEMINLQQGTRNIRLVQQNRTKQNKETRMTRRRRRRKRRRRTNNSNKRNSFEDEEEEEEQHRAK